MSEPRNLMLDGPDSLKVIKSLSCPIRLKILNLLATQMLSISDIASELDISLQSAGLKVKQLREAGLIHTYTQSGIRGSQRICSRLYDSITIKLPGLQVNPGLDNVSVTMPIGNYREIDVEATCGIASETVFIGYLDDPRSFFEPESVFAQLLWVGKGSILYQFPNHLPLHTVLDRLELTMEICSEAPNYNEEWPSDITLWINDVEIGTWTSPGDFGKKRGQLTPSWWLDRFTQYGFLKSWLVTQEGSFIDGVKISDVKLGELKISPTDPTIAVRIGNKEGAKNPRGFNLFGRKFGNYPQDIVLTLHYVKDHSVEEDLEKETVDKAI